MKSLFLAAFAALAFSAPVFAEDAKLNANCFCGKAVDATVAPVTIKVGEAEKQVAVCSTACGAAAGKMDGAEVWKQVEAHNKAGAPLVK